MRSRPWERLVRELGESGFQSPYLDRLRARLDLEQAHQELEEEIRREMASALGRAEDRICLALLELELLEREIAAPSGGCPAQTQIDRVNEQIAAYNRQRDVARRCLWELVVHREALGLRRNEVLRTFYPIPPKKEKRAPGGAPAD